MRQNGRIREFLRRDAATGGRPHLGKSMLDAAYRGSTNFDARITPWWNPSRGIPQPAVAHADPGDKRDFAIDRKGLAMIATEPAHRAVDARCIESPDLDAGCEQDSPVSARGACERAQPVVQHSDLDPCAGTVGQRRGKFAAYLIVLDDVVFEKDRLAGGTDGGKPSGVVGGPVLEDADGVPLDKRRPGRTPVGLLDQFRSLQEQGCVWQWSDGFVGRELGHWATTRNEGLLLDPKLPRFWLEWRPTRHQRRRRNRVR